MNASGTMCFWSLDEGSRNVGSSESQYRDMSLPIQTLCLGIECPLNVSFSPNTNQLVVVTKTQWMVISCSTYRIVMKFVLVLNFEFVLMNIVNLVI